MKTIRSSEIGTYLFCQRAWWYAREGKESDNQAEMKAGTTMHEKHGRSVVAAGLTRGLATIVLLVSIVMMVAYCTAQVF